MTTSPHITAAINAAKEAGETLKKQFGNIKVERVKDENAAGVVTKLDTQTEEFLFEQLTKHDSSIGFKGEEFGLQKTAERFWLVDPIDGTGFFIRGIPLCTTMLALIDHGEVVGSVLYDFVRDDVYHAEKGKGAFCNNKSIHVSNRNLSEAYINMESRLDTKEDQKKYLEMRSEMVLIGSAIAGFEFIYVATGKMDARINLHPYGKDYDFAPGSLLISEAGGIVTNIGKKTYDYTNTNLIAANPTIYKELTSGPKAFFKIDAI